MVLLICLLVMLVLQLRFGAIVLPAWLLAVALLWLYRDPNRQIPSQPLCIVSPVDGVVIDREAGHDRFLQREALHIRISMSPGGVFSVRSLTEGKVMQIWQEQNGNGHCLAIWVQTDEQDDTVLVLRPGRVLHRLSHQLAYGDRVGHGQRIGHILFGNVVDVYLPASARSTIEPGQRVLAGCDGIAELMG